MNPAQPLFSAAPLLWGDTPETPVLGMPGRTRIILADDHPVVLMGAEMALCPPFSQDFAIVAQAQSAEELVEHLEQKPCDILITDYAMPYGEFPDGLALIGYIRRHFGHVRLIVMTMLSHPCLLQALLNLDVCALFDKRSALPELKRATESVLHGRRYLCPTFARILHAQTLLSAGADKPSASLSERELEVVRMFVQGLSGRQIALQLNRSEKTISRQKRTAMDKLGLEHDGGLVEFARVSGLHV
ncbi:MULTISPECIES: response regulator transcription factor [Pseudomonas]|jgi:two-component system capsular synthesis response regulator RcsB|uniref:Response regulator transcription factor n=1 Tax=Pseudomonas kielensis TaxID=2762577 RepID=A0A7X1KW72_9PSED|nr:MULTISPECIES: response regulator transcription factor [Pseudomonas]MBC2688927.1 response regulator transcription factor [Pseudomonas kielensis]NBB35738.1 response regulator [Pseudomonas sp. BC115LW]UZM15191.1 response regulator transcription factor [Pseudomonas kielensis]WKL52671.1 response regulator transcription factor [Pseudomonas kielensis]